MRAKTPKITYYSAKAKCDLMENLDNFELLFYDGEKIVRTSEKNVTFYDSDGNTIAMTGDNDSLRSLYHHYQQCFEHCRTLERTLSAINCDGECFPIIVGRRPASAPVLSVSKCNSNNLLTPKCVSYQSKVVKINLNFFQIDIRIIRILQASSLMSLNSVTSTRTSQAKLSPMFHTPTEKVIVPGIGVATQLPEGVVEVTYPDGSRLAVKQPENGGGVTFTQTNGSQCHYTSKDELPEVVRVRLTQMPIVIKQLMHQNTSSMPICTPVSNKCIQPQIKYFR